MAKLANFFLGGLSFGLGLWLTHQPTASTVVGRDLKARPRVEQTPPQQRAVLSLFDGLNDPLSTLRDFPKDTAEHAWAKELLLKSDPFSLLAAEPSEEAMEACALRDPAAALQWWRRYGMTKELKGTFKVLFLTYGKVDPVGAMKAADSLQWSEGKWYAQCAATCGMVKKDPQAAIQYFTNLPDDSRATIGIMWVVELMKGQDCPPGVYLHLIGEQWANYRHNDPLSEGLGKLQAAGSDAAKAHQAHQEIYRELRDFRDQMHAWAASEPEAAMQWSANFPEPEVRKAVQAAMVVGQVKDGPVSEAAAAISAMPPEYRRSMIEDYSPRYSVTQELLQAMPESFPGRAELEKESATVQ
jgi:hypothetical protein